MPRDLTRLPSIQALVRRGLSEYRLFEAPGLEGLSEHPEVRDFDSYVADIEGEDNMDLSELGHRESIRLDYDQHREQCSIANLAHRKSVVDIIYLAVCSARA